jgi:hypothetical protein
MDLKDTRYEDMDWIPLAEDKIQVRTHVNNEIILCIAWKLRILLTSWASIIVWKNSL